MRVHKSEHQNTSNAVELISATHIQIVVCNMLIKTFWHTFSEFSCFISKKTLLVKKYQQFGENKESSGNRERKVVWQ